MVLILGFNLNAHAQRIRVHSNSSQYAQGNSDDHLYMAGVSLRRAANYDFLSWGLAAVSIISFTTTNGQDKNVVGVTCASLAIVSKVLSLSYKYKSGIELQLAAGSISVSF